MMLKKWFKKESDYRAEFLPSALEIIEKPESPLGKLIIWMIFAIIVIAIAWSIIGRVDEVAVAEGKVIPNGDIKVIQSLEGGVVTAIHVQEGEHVKAGQRLIDLDTAINQAELSKLITTLETAKVERALLQADYDGNSVQIKKLLKDNAHLSIDPAILKRQTELKGIRQQDQAQKQSSLATTVEQSMNERDIATVQLEQIETKIKVLKDQIAQQKVLFETGAGPKKDMTDLEDELKLTLQQKKQQETQIKLCNTQIKAKQNDVALGSVTYQKTLIEDIVTKDKAIQDLEKEVEKMQKRLSFQSVIAPVDGIVQGVSANTIGGIVSSEKPIVTIVPDNTPLVMEAMVLNKDIGFVHKGQKVDIKLDTFPFQKYGCIIGTIETISPDAVKDEKLGYVYKIKVKPTTTTLRVDSKIVSLSPGMTAQAEVKTGMRRIIDFFVPGLEEVKDGFEIR